MAASKAKPPEEDPLGVYLQIRREGDSDATIPSKQFWIGALSEGGPSFLTSTCTSLGGLIDVAASADRQQRLWELHLGRD
jgi:hypothetical protein